MYSIMTEYSLSLFTFIIINFIIIFIIIIIIIQGMIL